MAETVIEEMVGFAERQIELDLPPVKEDCMRPYMYPETIDETRLALDLVSPVKQAATDPVSDASAAMLTLFMDALLTPNPPKDTDGRREDSGRGG